MTPQQRASFLELVDKYLAGTATAEERAVVEQYDALFADAPDALDNLNAEQLVRIEHQLKLKIKARIRKAESPAVPLYRRWKGIGPVPAIWKVAAAFAAITLGTWMYYAFGIGGSSSRGIEGSLAYAEDIKPGSVGATLTLANGKTIKLSDATNGELAKEAGVTIKKTADGQLIYEIASSSASSRNDGAETKTNTLSTAKGETYQVKLPDGTAVWLNAASRLTYSATLNQQGHRRVALEGEAYFQVAKDKKHPFIVESKGQRVEVLGTHFNINAYADEGATKTTLLEGSVSVSSLREGTTKQPSPSRNAPRNDGKGHTATILKPNQQATLKGETLTMKQVDPSESIAWKNGYFSFTDENIQTVMQIISRWYNVEISYEGKITKEGFNGKISRFKKLSEVLNMLEDTRLVHFKIEGRRVIVKK